MKILFLGGLIAGGLIVAAVFTWRGSARLEAKLAELRAKGEPIQLTDLARKPIPPEENAATYLRRAKDNIKAIESEVEAAYEAAPESEQRAMDEGVYSPALQAVMKSSFEAYPEVVGLLIKAAACRDYDSQFDYTAEPRTFLEGLLEQRTRSAMRVLSYWAALQAIDGHSDESVQTAIAMLRLTRQFDRDPAMVCYLVSLACRWYPIRAANVALRSGEVRQETHNALEAELAADDLAAAAQHALRTERAVGMDLYRDLKKQMGFFPAPWMNGDRADYLDLMAEAITVAPLPNYDSAGRAKYDAMVKNTGHLTKLLVPTLQAMGESTCRTQARIRCLRIINVLTRTQQAADAPAPQLADLGLPREVTIDPYTGQPLHLTKLPDGWLVYSVGKNLKDDGGGDLESDLDVGLGPPKKPGDMPAADDAPKVDEKASPESPPSEP